MHRLRCSVPVSAGPPAHRLFRRAGRAAWFCAAATALALVSGARAAAPWDPDAVTLEAHELASGVFAVLPDDAFDRDHTATTAGFVVGERGVLLVETMVNERLTRQLLARVAEVTDKPIRYVVNTSYHGDHSYGNALLPDDVIVIQHPATAAYIESSFAADRAFMVDLMGPGKGIEEVVPRAADVRVDTSLTIDLGRRVAEVRHFGFAQTPGDLVVWLPDEKVLWVGNMVQAPPPALPWLLEGRHRETLATLARVHEFLPADATVIPGHGRPMTPDGIDFSIRYLEELDRRVAAGIAAGMDLEAVRRDAAMRDYADYSLFGWAHDTVNVPAAFETLSGAPASGGH